jgi:PST family polysaccharide transporter
MRSRECGPGAYPQRKSPSILSLSLGRQLLAGGIWATIDSWASELANLLLYLILARLLGPAELGLVALAGVFTTLAGSLTVYGVMQVIIQKPDLEPADCDAVFLLTMGGSIAAALLLVLASPAVAGLFAEPELGPILVWLSLGVVIQALGAVPLGLLTRELRFGVTARRSLLMIASGGAVGIAMAITGHGAWALVAQHVVGTSVGSLVLLTATGWRPGLRARWRHLRASSSFVASAVGNRLLLFADERGPQLVIGYMLGPAATGLYNLAIRLVEVMIRLFVVPVNQIAMPGFARVQGDSWEVLRLLRMTLATGTLVSAPIFLGAAVLAPTLVDMAFGPRWAAMVPVLQILALRGIVWPLLLQGQSLLYGLGRPERMLRVNMADLAVNLSLLILATPFGLVPMAAVITARIFFWRWPLLAVEIEAAAGLRPIEQVRLMVPAMLAAASMAAFVAWSLSSLPPDLSATMRVALTLPAGAILYLGLLFLLDRRFLVRSARQLAELVRSLRKDAHVP